jgi:hypothetical protein
MCDIAVDARRAAEKWLSGSMMTAELAWALSRIERRVGERIERVMMVCIRVDFPAGDGCVVGGGDTSSRMWVWGFCVGGRVRGGG